MQLELTFSGNWFRWRSSDHSRITERKIETLSRLSKLKNKTLFQPQGQWDNLADKAQTQQMDSNFVMGGWSDDIPVPNEPYGFCECKAPWLPASDDVLPWQYNLQFYFSHAPFTKTGMKVLA